MKCTGYRQVKGVYMGERVCTALYGDMYVKHNITLRIKFYEQNAEREGSIQTKQAQSH